MTIQQIWEEYRQEQPDGYSYSQFCYHFQVWRDGDEVTMHIEHKVGDKLFVDFAGKKLTVSERHGGGRREVESFVAVLGASQLGYLNLPPGGEPNLPLPTSIEMTPDASAVVTFHRNHGKGSPEYAGWR